MLKPLSRYLVRYLLTAARFGAIIAIAYFLYNQARHGFGVDWRMQYAWAFLGAQPVFFTAIFLLATRHARMVRTPPIPISFALKAVTLSSGLNMVLPGRLSELLKGTYLRDRCGIPLSSAFAAVFWERFIDLIIMASLAVFLIGATAGVSWPLLGGLVALAISLPAFANLERIFGPLALRIPAKRFRMRAQALLRHLTRVSAHNKDPHIWLLSLGAWGLSCSSFYVLVMLTSGTLPPLLSVAQLFLASTFALAIPLLPGGFGTFEAAVLYVLKLQGYTSGDAFMMTLLMRLHQMTLPTLGAMIILSREKVGVASLIQSLRAEAAHIDSDGTENAKP